MEHQQHWCLELNLQTGKSNLNRQTLSLNHSQTPACYYFNPVSELKQPASKNKFEAAKRFFFFFPTATQLRSEQSKVLKMTQLIYVRNIRAAVQLGGKATTTTKKSLLEESFYTSVPPSRSFKSCSGKLEKNNLGHMHSNKHPCAST